MLNTIETLCNHLVYGGSLRNDLDFIQSLKKTGIIQKANPLKEIKCTLCDKTHLAKVIELSNDYYISCEYSGATKKLNNGDLTNSKVNIHAFTTWLSNQLGFEEEPNVLDDGAFYLGQYSSHHFILVLEDDFETCMRLISSSNVRPKVVLWCGENPLTGYINETLIPLEKLLQLTNEGFSLNTPLLEDYLTLATHKKDDIVLDDNIVLQNKDGKYFVLIEEQNYGYKYKEKIREQTFRIVRLLFDMRMHGTGLTSQEVTDRLHYSNAKSIPTRINELNKVCVKYNAPEPVVENPNNKWALNPLLNCFN